MACLMGIDLGTASLKTLLVDETGAVLALAAKNYKFSSPINGYAEHHPDEWWEACCQTVKEVLKKSGIPADEIKGISFSGQMHGLVMLDKDHKVIRPAILHCDARSSKQTKEMKELFVDGRMERLLLNPIYTGFLLPSLLWVREMEPQNYERIKYVMLPKDYLKFKLTGEFTSDHSDASATLAYDIRKNEWSKEILDIVGVSEDIFPTCYNTDDTVGKVCASAARETGLSVNTAIVAGGGDQVMQGIGNGITKVGEASVNIGSSGQVSFQSDTPIWNPSLSTNTFCGYKKGRWFTMGAIMSAGLSMKWCNDLLEQREYVQLNEAVAKVKPGSRGLIYLPYLNGERTPHLNADLSGQFVGVTMNTGRPEFTRAVMEGVAYAFMQCIEVCGELGLTTDTMVASGGGARSIPWLQIQADVFNKRLRVTDTEEQACLGAVIAAGSGVGIYSDIEEGCQTIVKYKDIEVFPNMENHKLYQEYYQLYKDIYVASNEVLEKVTLIGRRV